MIKNNNYAVIERMAKTNLKSNRRRSITMIFAVMLSVFLLFSVFTVGATYLKMQKLQNIRLNGADFDAIMYGITEKQKTLLETNEDVEQYGILTVVGAVKETAMDKTPGVGLLYADPVLWNEMMAPARSFMKGRDWYRIRVLFISAKRRKIVKYIEVKIFKKMKNHNFVTMLDCDRIVIFSC